MIGQVAPLVTMKDATDLSYWSGLGWKAALGTVVLVGLMFAIYKGKIKFVVVGRNEKGARELFGFPIWPVFRAAHLHIEGIFSVRKAPVVPVPIELRQHILGANREKMEYVGTAFVVVGKQWKDLKQAIYSTLDTDKKDLENELRDKQSRSIILGGTRQILSDRKSAKKLTLKRLDRVCGDVLREELGSILVKLVTEEYTPVYIQVLATSVQGRSVPSEVIGTAASPSLAKIADERPPLEAVADPA